MDDCIIAGTKQVHRHSHLTETFTELRGGSGDRNSLKEREPPPIVVTAFELLHFERGRYLKLRLNRQWSHQRYHNYLQCDDVDNVSLL